MCAYKDSSYYNKKKYQIISELMFRYKIVVEVVIGEQRGEGVRMGSRYTCIFLKN